MNIKTWLLLAFISLNHLFPMAQVNRNNMAIGSMFANEGCKMPEGTYKLISGGYEVFTIASSDKSFQPVSLYYGEHESDKVKIDAMAPDGKVPTAMNCFVVNTPEGYIMFDTGLPSSKGGKTLDRLASLKISPSDIKAIYLTHGHFDHIGELVGTDAMATFADATVFISSSELAFIRESMADATAVIEAAYKGRIVVFEPGEILLHNVLPISAKGHTPGHTAYQLGHLLFVGDIMHGVAIQMLDPSICAGYDADRDQSIRTRKEILRYAAANSLTVLGSHVPCNGVIF